MSLRNTNDKEMQHKGWCEALYRQPQESHYSYYYEPQEMLSQRYQPNDLSHARLRPQSLLHLQHNSYEVLDHRIRRSSREERVLKELKAVHHQRR